MPEAKIDWVRGKPRKAIEEYLLWRKAVECADGGDVQSLIDLLRTDHVPGPEARVLIADLLSRYALKRPRHRPATPAYKTTLDEARMNDAAALVRYYREKGMSEDEAIQQALREQKRASLSEGEYKTDGQLDELISEAENDTLRYRVRGQRGSTRRMAKRRSAHNS
jgi:hypothetical protein